MTAAVTRRTLFRTAGAGSALGAMAANGPTEAVAQQSTAASTPERVEPVTIKRRGAGLRGYDSSRAFDGFTLFSPLPSSNKTVYLIDMRG